MQGCRGTARTCGPADLWHGPARKILARKILARHGPQNIGTEKYWHGMARQILPQNSFYWGAVAPQTPCCSWGASSPPDPLAGGLQTLAPPRSIFERLRLSSSPFFSETKILVPRSCTKIKSLVPRSWCQALGTRILVADLGTKLRVVFQMLHVMSGQYLRCQ